MKLVRQLSRLSRCLNPREIHLFRSSFQDTLIIGGIGIGAFVVMRWFLPISHVPSISMEPTIEEGSRVLVNNLAFRTHPPSRGDVVVFDSGYRAGLLNLEKVKLVKRVVGLPGETIKISFNGRVYIDGEPIDEDYATVAFNRYPETTIPEGHYFLLGDNRNKSHDSRVIGPVEMSQIEGRAMTTLWPFSAIE